MTKNERQASSWRITSIHVDSVLDDKESRQVMEIMFTKVPLTLNNKENETDGNFQSDNEIFPSESLQTFTKSLTFN